ncbi:MAG TPA: class I SAM-dependent methyltransferase [Solirubrobacteraceae bacterium]|nr:class I SAM-dependent methyltransferase [Solirubrobacteraceae bacterium]
MAERAGYDEIASVYEFLVPDALLSPQGSFGAFAEHVEPGACVLDCACGTGTLAVGLALAGCEVVATDASAAMVARTAELAAAHGARVEASVCDWAALPERGWDERFDVVFCVGNSLPHAPGRAARRAALRAMAAALRPGGLLVVTSRTWEQVRAGGSRLQVAERLVERDGRRGLPIYAWTIPERWDEPHVFEVAVAVVAADGAVATCSERFEFWPFTEGELLEDLGAAGLEPEGTGVPADKAGRYLVTARRVGGGA